MGGSRPDRRLNRPMPFALGRTASGVNCEFNIPLSGSCTIGVAFIPYTVGTLTGTLTISYEFFVGRNGPFFGAAVISLEGTGNAASLTSITVTPAKPMISLRSQGAIHCHQYIQQWKHAGPDELCDLELIFTECGDHQQCRWHAGQRNQRRAGSNHNTGHVEIHRRCDDPNGHGTDLGFDCR